MVWERIGELRKQEEQRARDKTVQEEANRIKIANEKATKAQQEETERRREIEENRRITKEVLEKSGALPIMREIEKGLVGNVRKHAIIENLDGGNATLAWGNKFKVEHGEIAYEKHFLSWPAKDYSYIRANVNLPSQSVTIGNKEVKKDQWSTNGGIVQDLLAQAYLHPKRVNERKEPPGKYSSSGGSSSSSECCNQ